MQRDQDSPSPKPVTNESGHLSRRDFARGVALAAATIAIPSQVLAQTDKPAAEAAKATTPKLPELPPDSQAEAELSYELLMKRFGSRFSEEQKSDLKRLVYTQQKGLDSMRAYQLDNSDEPALVLKLVRNGENL